MLLRLSAVFFLALGVCRCQTDNELSPRGSKRIFLSALAQARPISNGINQISRIVTDGMRTKTQIIQNGLTNMTNQFNDMTVQVAQQTAAAIETGRTLMKTAVEQISLPAVAATTSLAIASFNAYLRNTGQDVQTLPAVSTSLWGFGSFQTSEGRLARLSTLLQDGPVRVNLTGVSLGVSVPIRLGELTVTYPRYTHSSWAMSLEGNITARVRENGLVAHIRLLDERGCALNVERVEVVRFGDLDIDMTGLCNFCSSVATFIANFLQGVIQSHVQAAIDEGLRKLFAAEGSLICSRLQRT